MTQYPCARGRAFVCKNIGDYVQSVASRQFVAPIDHYIEQEEADTFVSDDGSKCRLIMNGWFQWRAENWPPSKDVLPLLVSMHISPLREKQLLTEQGIAFLKRHSPVGCRDKYTENLLRSHGIPSYFSACVTLTLGNQFRISEDKQRKGVYFVDPYFEIPELYREENGQKILCEEVLADFIEGYSRHAEIINELSRHRFFTEYSPTGFLDRNRSPYRALYKAFCFYKVYSQRFSDELLAQAEYITHWMDVDMAGQTNLDLLNLAEGLVRTYAQAELVVTSRIHAGLPCLGMETPVIFVANEQVLSETGTFNTPGRLGGLVELFRILKLENGEFSSEDPVLAATQQFSRSTSFRNKTDWEPYARQLTEQLTAFMADDFTEEQYEAICNMHL